MFANAGSVFSRLRLAPAPSRLTLLIAVMAAGFALSGPGASAVAQNGPPVRGGAVESAGGAEDATIQAEATRLQGQYHTDAAALSASAKAALSAGRNDATIAFFLKRGWAGRLSAGLERYGTMLNGADSQALALGAAGIQYFGTQLRRRLLEDSPRLITLSLQAQRLTGYDRGQVVVETPVTTGRPTLETDIGAMRVIRKDSPWTMQSPWPKGSPNWYPDTPVRMVLWFTKTGEGLHDASWQPDSTLGPGSQHGPFASHGCVHVPLAAMTTLFQWAPIGTPVVVYPGDGASAASQVAQQTVDSAGEPLSGVRGA